MRFSKELSIKYNPDICVIGAGPAGIAAAVAAARRGKSVFLAEAQGAFGGSGTVGLVPAFMQFTDDINFLADGIGREIYEKITDIRDYKVHCINIKVEKLKRIYDDMVKQAKVDFSFFTTLSDVVCDSEGHVDYCVMSAKSGMFAVKAKIYIDCTGDGDLCAWGGNDFEHGNEEGLTMPSTLCSLWGCIDFTRHHGPDNREIERAFADKVFTNEDRHLPGMFPVDPEHGIGGGNIGHCFAVNATDERSLTEAMLWGRKSMEEYERYYKEYLEGCENMVKLQTANILGIRESRRIIGDYVLNGEDFINRQSFEDEIGRYSYPVDIHIMKPDKASHDAFTKEYGTLRYKSGESYGIPYRALCPKNLSNVLVAGRCISTDRQMQASIRVMPGCYITGQAAGCAAVLACEREDIRSFKVTELQKSLKALGAYLPNFD